MTSSTSSSSRALTVWGLLVLLVLSGCASPQRRADAPLEPGSLLADGDVDGPLAVRSRTVAVLPLENLSGGKAPLEDMGLSLRKRLKEDGLRLLEDRVLTKFMKRHRIRNTGSLSSHAAKAFKDEVGVEAVLMTSLEAYKDGNPPKISLISRLLLSGEEPEIVWMDGIGLSGEESPGLLGLGRIEEADALLERATRYLTESLMSFLAGEGPTSRSAPFGAFYGRHRPRTSFRSPIIDATRGHSIAVIPFLNRSERRSAGKIVTLHFVKQLTRTEIFAVVEPGLVREQLLKYRVIMPAGPSLANADLISNPDSLGVDLVLSGTVFDYQDAVGIPKVDFSVKIIEKRSREVVWSSRSYNNGEEGVFFFDLGRVHTAHLLASEMVRETTEALGR